MTAVGRAPRSDLPPIVLLVDRHRDALERYSRCLEDAGLWVATTSVPDEVVAAAEELKPDIIVADADEAEPARADEIVHTLRQHPALGGVPIIVMTSEPRTQAHADSVLIKPVAPSLLVHRTHELLLRARETRARAAETVEQGSRLVERSSALLAECVRRPGFQRPDQRTCPDCGDRLEWVEQGTVGDITYDYYRWCLKGCGLYCFDRERSKWVKLA